MTLTIEMAAQFVAVLVALGGFAFGFIKWVLALVKERDKEIAKEREERLLSMAAEWARAKAAEDELTRALNAHKLYAAENFATTNDLSNALSEVKAAIEKLADRLDKLLMDKKP